MSKKPTVLMILDGYGLSEKTNGNAVAEAKTPVMDKLMAECPFVRGNASGMAVRILFMEKITSVGGCDFFFAPFSCSASACPSDRVSQGVFSIF